MFEKTKSLLTDPVLAPLLKEAGIEIGSSVIIFICFIALIMLAL